MAPFGYSTGPFVDLLKPSIKGLKYNTLAYYSLKDIVIEPHVSRR